MKRGKKLLSLFLAVAIAVSGINFAGVFEVNAANEGIMTVSGDGTLTPGEGLTPGDGSTTPGDGTTTPGDGSTTPGDGTTVTKTALAAAIDAAEAKNEADYTADSWSAMQEKLTTAKTVYANESATQAQVDTATNELNAAVEALVPVTPSVTVDKAALKTAIDAAEAKNEADYTADSWSAMQEKLTTAKTVYANESATQAQVDTATNELNAAVEALVPVTPSVTVDKAALKTAIDNAKAKKQAEYTAQSWSAMQAKLTTAESVYANESATQAQVDTAAKELNDAVNALVKVTPPATVNKTALKAAIDAASKLLQKDYTAQTWTVFQNALNNAKAIYAKANATQTEVDNAVTALKNAQNNLKAAPAPFVKVTKVTITNGKSIKIAAGKKVKLAATVAPKNASNKAVTWSISSKDKKYATLKGSTVTTKKAGAGKKIKVTALAKDGSKKKATITITIMKNAVTKVSLKAKKTVKAGKKITVKATVKTNGKKANKTLKWSLDKKSAKFASVNKKGVVTVKKAAKKGLKIKVTATATDGSNKKGTITIKVVK